MYDIFHKWQHSLKRSGSVVCGADSLIVVCDAVQADQPGGARRKQVWHTRTPGGAFSCTEDQSFLCITTRISMLLLHLTCAPTPIKTYRGYASTRLVAAGKQACYQTITSIAHY